jgi:diacylglycerol kinase family enzyme
MRALLVANPRATATTPRGRDVLARALESELKVEVAETAYRGHGIELARQARQDGVDVVVSLGGDGTVNEVVNGLLADGVGADVPVLAAVPSGSTNVFTRALGLSRDPVEATSEILDALRVGRSRRIGLGRADGRWFTFCAGVGIDAEVVAHIEQRRTNGDQVSGDTYVRTTLLHWAAGGGRRHPTLTVHRDGGEPIEHVFTVLVANTAPWSYLGSHPINPCPQASFDTGLDLLALRRFNPVALARLFHQMLTGGPQPPGNRYLPDQSRARITAEQPLSVQVDGDYIGERAGLALEAVPEALRVIA